MHAISRIVLAAAFSLLTVKSPLAAQTGIGGAEKQQALTLELNNTSWTMLMLGGENPWGELYLSKNGLFTTTGGPDGKWKVREKLTVGLDDEFLIRFLPNKTMEVFGKGGRRIATGTRSEGGRFEIQKPDPEALRRAIAAVNSGGTRKLPPELRGRAPELRAELMKRRQMRAESEIAVKRGIEWLRQNQNGDGSWGDKNKGGMTGFALLCFLGHGETGESTQSGIAVNRAIQWMIDSGTKSLGRLSMDDQFTQPGVYEHGIATLALAEYYAMTEDERILELLKQAVSYIVTGQGPDGGWMYGYDRTQSDTSVSGWQFQALYAAHLTGLKLPGVEAALDRAILNFDRVRGPKGGFGYRSAVDRYSLTGVGLLSNLIWKGNRDKLRGGMKWMLDETEKMGGVNYRGPTEDIYAWYFHTNACARFGGPEWVRWNKWFQDEIVQSQSEDGSWPLPGGGKFGPANEESRTGQVYRTALCILMLESAYRYVPVQ